MSYDLTLQCGCVVYVSCDPKTHVAHTRLIQSRGGGCQVRRHEIGLRLYLWEILPDRTDRPQQAVTDRRPVFGEKRTDQG
jgi:hypothetical protein